MNEDKLAFAICVAMIVGLKLGVLGWLIWDLL